MVCQSNLDRNKKTTVLGTINSYPQGMCEADLFFPKGGICDRSLEGYLLLAAPVKDDTFGASFQPGPARAYQKYLYMGVS